MSNALHQIELSIEEARKLISLGDSLERLRSNRDFKKLINDGYFDQEAIRLVHLKSDPNMQSADSQKAIISQMDSIGSFKQFLQTVAFKSNMAAKAIEADEQTREELLAEGLQ